MANKKAIKELKEQEKVQQNQRNAINKKIDQLRTQIYRLDIEPRAKAMVGRRFKYRNSYGGERKDWWLYSKVIGYDQRNQMLIICSYQRTSLPKIEIVTEAKRYTTNPLDDHLFQIPITSKQFDAVLNRAIKELEKMKNSEAIK